MAFCVNYNKFEEFLHKIDQAVEIDRTKENDLRYNVWGTTPQQIKDMFSKGIDSLPWNDNNSRHIKAKVEGALKRIEESPESAADFVKEIINDEDGNNIEFSIALHELMESVKGESDKARNLGIDVAEISDTGILPALPLSRVAASIGRKIAYQKGYRFKTDNPNDVSAADIEAIYYGMGKLAIEGLELKGYVKTHENLNTIKDYIDVNEIKKEFPKTNVVTDKALSVTINESKIGVKAGSKEANYFLNRTESDVTDTKLGTIADMLRAIRQVTQPAETNLPDTSVAKTKAVLAESDDPNIGIDPVTAEARKKLYDKPLFINTAVQSLVELLNKESKRSGQPASKILKDKFQGSENLINSLFGLKRSDNYSIDKKESIAGQNLSKTAPLDDLVDFYEAIQGGNTEPVPLHLALKNGRNARLYYTNTVLNPHGSKHSRYMLTAGKYTVDMNSADYDYLVNQIADALGDKNLTYKDFTGETKSTLDDAIKVFDRYQSANTLQKKLAALSSISLMFPGTDYVTLLTTLQAIVDIRSPVNGKVTTEFLASADATASGGTLTFLQALGTNPEVEAFLQRIGLLKKPDGSVDVTLNDLYGLMTESITKFINGEVVENLINQDLRPEATGPRLLMADTVNLLFNSGEDTRELSKDPTMTFVYGQGRKGATATMARSLADRIIDNLDDPKTREYLVKLFNDKQYENIDGSKLKDTKGLYSKIVNELQESGLTGQLYDIMDASINQQYLSDFKDRSTKVFDMVKKISSKAPFKILPAAAVLAGIKPTRENLQKYGMPLTKVFEVSNKTRTGNDTVLTRKQKLTKTVADVSTIHGIDAAQLYGSINKVISDKGMVVIHDDVRGTVQDVRAMEEQYRKTTVEITEKYDIHQQILAAVAAYDPKLAQTEGFKALDAEIASQVENKRKVIKESFNESTSALIGDGDKFQKFAGNETADQGNTDTGTNTETEAKVDNTESIEYDTKPSKVQSFGNATIEVEEDGVVVKVLAGEYWKDIQKRLKVIEELKICLTK